MNQKKSQI